MLVLSILTQMIIDTLVFRWYLQTYQPQADRSWRRVLRVVGLLLAMLVFPVAGAYLDRFAHTRGTLLLVGLGVAALGKLAVVKFALKTTILGGIGVLLMCVAAGAVLGLPGLLHPLLPLLLALGVAAYQFREERSLAQIQALAEPTDH